MTSAMEVFFFLPKSVPNNLGTLGIDPSSSASVPNNSVLMAADRSNGFVVTCAFHTDYLTRDGLPFVPSPSVLVPTITATVSPSSLPADHFLARMPSVDCQPGSEFRFGNELSSSLKLWSHNGIVHWSGSVESIEQIDIYNAMGAKMRSLSVHDYYQLQYDMSIWSKGIYFVKYKEHGQEVKSLKLIN